MGRGDFKKIYILQTDLERKNFLQGNTLLIKTPTLEKISFMAYNVGKKILIHCVSGKNLSLEIWEKTNSYTNQITHSHPSPHPLKSQMVGPLLGIDKEPLKKRVPFGE